MSKKLSLEENLVKKLGYKKLKNGGINYDE